MILWLLLHCLQPLTALSRVPNIPPHFAKSSLSCELEFSSEVRRVHPVEHIVTGEQFIAQYDLFTCQILSQQKHEDSSCSNSGGADCRDTATSLVRVDDVTLHFCFSDNNNPKPFTADLTSDKTYDYKPGGTSEICIHDPNKNTFTHLNSGDQLVYIASGAFEAGYKYQDLVTGVTRNPPSPSLSGGSVVEVIGIFTRGDYFYSIYQGTDVSKVTRSCKKDLLSASAGSSMRDQLTTHTAAQIQCEDNISGQQVILDRILSLEYNSDMDKLFVLATKKPVGSSAISLCVLDVETDIDTVLDTGNYVFIDESGDEIMAGQGAVDCSAERSRPVNAICADIVTTTTVPVTLIYTDILSFASFKTGEHDLLYFLSDNNVYVYEYDAKSETAHAVETVGLWEKAKQIAILGEKLYLTLEHSVLVTDPYWCSYYQRDPVACVAAKNPSCSYSKVQSTCVPTIECVEQDECVQDLVTGSFSSLFPTGYSYQILGTDCQDNKIYTDITVSYDPDGNRSSVTSYRDCSPEPPKTKSPEPVVNNSSSLSSLEIGLIAAVAGLVTLSVFLLSLLLCRGHNKVGITCNSFGLSKIHIPKKKYATEDKRAIVSNPPTPSPDHFNHPNGKELVIRNLSAQPDPNAADTDSAYQSTGEYSMDVRL